MAQPEIDARGSVELEDPLHAPQEQRRVVRDLAGELVGGVQGGLAVNLIHQADALGPDRVDVFSGHHIQ
jgi:hypothetical protein